LAVRRLKLEKKWGVLAPGGTRPGGKKIEKGNWRKRKLEVTHACWRKKGGPVGAFIRNVNIAEGKRSMV